MAPCQAPSEPAPPQGRIGLARAAFLAGGKLLLAAALLAPAAARATDIEVHVQPVDGKGGLIRAMACTRAEFLKQCSYNATAAAHPGDVTVTIRGVKPGVYAVIAFHDVQNTGEVVQDAIGMPEEGVGFSNDPLLMLGPPSFGDTSLLVEGRAVRVDITLKFEP